MEMCYFFNSLYMLYVSGYGQEFHRTHLSIRFTQKCMGGGFYPIIAQIS